MEAIKKFASGGWWLIKVIVLINLVDNASSVWNGSLGGIAMWTMAVMFIGYSVLTQIQTTLDWYYSERMEMWRFAIIMFMLVASIKYGSAAPFLYYSAADLLVRMFASQMTLPWWMFVASQLPDTGTAPVQFAAAPSPAPVPAAPTVKYVEKVVEKVVEKPVHVLKTKGEVRMFKAGFGIGNCATCSNWFGPRELQMGTDMIFADPRALGRCSIFKNRRMASTTCDSYQSAV